MTNIPQELQTKIDNLDDDLKKFVYELIKKNESSESRLERIMKQSDTQQLKLVKLNEKIESAAQTDPLTSSFNRIKCEETLRDLLDQQKMFSIMIIDVDNFRAINEKYTLKIADQVLVQVSNIVKRFSNKDSFFSRWNRDSFILIDETLSLDDMVEKADEICDATEEYFFNNVGRVTVSIGVSRSYTSSDMQSIVQQLLQTLKKAKTNGKNQVSV